MLPLLKCLIWSLVAAQQDWVTHLTQGPRSISCALKNPTNWEAHKVILTLSHDVNKHTCTKEANAADTNTSCEGTVTELTITSGRESLNITADFTGDTNRVYVCSVSVDGVMDRKMIYAEKIVTRAYITHSDIKYQQVDNKGVQYATKKITTAHCGLYNNNNNPDVTIKMSAVAAGSEASYVAVPSDGFSITDPLKLVNITCQYTFTEHPLTPIVSEPLQVFVVELCVAGQIIDTTTGVCKECVDSYRLEDDSQFEPCLRCAPGQKPAGTTGYCSDCTGAHYSSSGKTCELCPDGTKPDSKNTFCILCDIGTAGTGGQCTACSVDNVQYQYHYAPVAGQTACTNCTGRITCDSSSNQCTSCDGCAMGEYVEGGECINSTCSDGEVKDANNICVKCPPGTFYRKVTKTVVSIIEEKSVNTTATTEECGPCQPGTFQDKAGMLQCEKCYDENSEPPKVMYQDEAGQTYCKTVLPGYSLQGFNSSAQATICQAGTYSIGNAAECTKCEPKLKTYSSNDGAQFCLECTIGKVNDEATNCGGVYCEADEFISDQITAENTTYYFNKTSANSLHEHSEAVECKTCGCTDREFITRFCRFDAETSTASWDDPNFATCSSKNSKELNDMATMDLTNSSAVAENAVKMEKMTNDTGALLPSDIALIASSLSKIGSIGAEKLDKEMIGTVTKTIGALAGSGEKLKSVSSEKKALLVKTLENMASASGNETVLQDTVAIRKIDLQNVILPRPKEMSEEELPSLDLGGDDGIQDENASVAIFAGDAKDLFPTPSTVIDPTGLKPAKRKSVGSCIVALTMKVEGGKKFKLSMSSNSADDATSYGTDMLIERDCHYLDTTDGEWKTDGCVTTYNKTSDKYECECNHTTSFAILLSISEIKDTFQDDFSTVMMSINIIFLTLTFLCLAPFKKFRSRRLMSIQIQLVLSLILANIAFLVLGSVSTVTVDENKNPLISLNVGCTVGIIIVEYLFLAVMAWMTCAAVTLYGKIVDALKTYGKIDRYYLTKCMIGCWGLPLVTPIASLITSWSINDMEYNTTSHINYDTPFIMSSGKNGTACWIATPWKQISFFLPCWTCLILNIVQLLMIARVIIRSAKSGSNTAGPAREIKALLTIGVTVGVPWIFAALTFDPIAQVFQWAFIILANLQGPIMFVCFVIFQEDVITTVLALFGVKSLPKFLSTPKSRSAKEISNLAKGGGQTSVTNVERDEKACNEEEEEEEEEAEYAAPDENLYSNNQDVKIENMPVPDTIEVLPVASAPEDEPVYSDTVPAMESTSFPQTDSDSVVDLPPPPPGEEEDAVYENKAAVEDSPYPHMPQLV